jgi:pyruvate/2-oxoglutarate/acetoin dehydrogenase E1 component
VSPDATRIRFPDAIGEALRLEFGRDPRALYVASGDDPLAEGLYAIHGSARVVQGREGERTLIAQAVGAALEGYHSVCRLSAASLPGHGLEQLVQAQGLNAVEGLSMPLTVLVDRPIADRDRTTDSDAPERWLYPAAVPTVSPSGPAEAKGLVAAALRSRSPACVIVDERLAEADDHVPEGGHLVALGRARLVREGSAATVVAHGASVGPVARLASELELDVEIVDLCSLIPFDLVRIVKSIKRTGRLGVFEPTYLPSPVADGVVAATVGTAFEYLDAPPLRIAMGVQSDAVLREALGELVGY